MQPIPDRRNANKGTERGLALLERSLRRTGAGRSIVLDANGQVIAGNKTLEVAESIGLPVRVVDTDGHALIALRRTDLDLDDPHGPAREMAYADNRVGEVSLAWDAEQLLADLEAGVPALADYWTEDELAALLDTPAADPDPAPPDAEPLVALTLRVSQEVHDRAIAALAMYAGTESEQLDALLAHAAKCRRER